MNTIRRLKTTVARAFPCNWCRKKPEITPTTPTGGNMEGHRALLVGINAYPSSPLNGCVNDITSMTELLTSSLYNFKSENIRLLVDSRATTAAILDHLNWLVQAQPGDEVLFHYSGHGAQVPTRNNAGEVDDLSEVVCPVDFDWSPERMITDKQFVEIFKKLPDGVIFNWLSDSCHSGDLDKRMPPPDVKFRRFPVPADILWRQRIAVHKKLERWFSKSKAMVGGVLDVGFMSGCQSDQTSADAYIDGRACGAFSYYFMKALREDPQMKLDDLGNKVCRYLAGGGYSQKPSTEGARKGRPFLCT